MLTGGVAQPPLLNLAQSAPSVLPHKVGPEIVAFPGACSMRLDVNRGRPEVQLASKSGPTANFSVASLRSAAPPLAANSTS